MIEPSFCLVLTAADESTWRKGIWDTLTTFGAALLQGAFIGGATGSVVSGTMSAGGAKLAKTSVGKLEDFATRASIEMDDLSKLSYSRRRMVDGLNSHIAAGEIDEAEKVLREMQLEIGADPATRIRKQLYVANGKPLAKPHIDAYMEQLIRRQGSAFDIGQEQWVELEGFLHGDPASLQTLIARSDEELICPTLGQM